MVVYSKLPVDQYGLSKVAPGIWFVQGDEMNRPEGSTDPTIILLFGWMDAKTAHLAKFSAGYRKLYPHTSQLVVASRAEIFILPKFVLRKRLRPAVVLLQSLGVIGTSATPQRVLTHALSNGGLCQLNYLSQMLVPSTSASQKYLTSAVVLDSTPGGDDLSSAIYVFNTTIRNPLFRYPFLVLLVTLHLVSFLLRRVPWHMHDIIRKAVINPKFLPWIIAKHTPFLYVYSKADKSVPFRHIQRHTEVAEKKGQLVERLVFENSEHVAHMRSDPERYWGAVGAHWAKAVANSHA